MKNYLLQRLEVVGKYFSYLGTLLRFSVKRPFYVNQFLWQIEHLGVNSIFVIFLSSFAMGMILSMQMIAILQDFSAEIGTGAAVAVAMCREIAPVITALMLIAKNGSAMAAELGTMKVTEQIDALEVMSIKAEHYLVLPKVAASLVVFPMLTLLSDLIGSLGAYIISVTLYNVESGGYLNYLFDFINPRDFAAGLIKSVFFGVIVSTICCFYGLNTEQGAKGVGDSATKAVVASSVSILMADYLLASLILKYIIYQ
jgi:phospholipid/cholesterol/gamma-HCH transport system permease protein